MAGCSSSQLWAVQLSTDCTPCSEETRIVAAGGTVVHAPGESSRVSDGAPGAIAVARAMGDGRFSGLGVVSTPVVQVLVLCVCV